MGGDGNVGGREGGRELMSRKHFACHDRAFHFSRAREREREGS